MTINRKSMEEECQPQQQQQLSGGSVLFQPHRTIGLTCTSHPFFLSHGSTSMDSFITVPQLERFVIYRCDSLCPVLVSDSLPSSVNVEKKRTQHRDKKVCTERMYHTVTDTSLSITVASHGTTSSVSKRSSFLLPSGATQITLFKRTAVMQTVKIVRNIIMSSRGNNSSKQSYSSSWRISHMISLGRSKFELPRDELEMTKRDDCAMDHIDDETNTNQNKAQNCVLIAILCSKASASKDIQDIEEGQHVGTYDESSNDDETSSSDDSANHESDEYDETEKADRTNFDSEKGCSGEGDEDIPCSGEVVIVLVSRNQIRIHKRIPLLQVPNFTPTIGIHPHTYLNKILIGSEEGNMLLLNIRTDKIIHHFRSVGSSQEITRLHKSPFCITALEQSPAVDTVAVGTKGGDVHLINLRLDVKLFTLTHVKSKKKQEYQGEMYTDNGVTSISFRTDGLALESGLAPIAVGLKTGSISIWDLTPKSSKEDSDINLQSLVTNGEGPSHNSEPRTLICQMEKVHSGGVSKLQFFPNEPLLISSGVNSNRIIMHVFDNPNHSGRILRQRQGHSCPPVLIRYVHPSTGGVLASMADGTDAASCQILSFGGPGDSTVRSFSTARSILDREFSQGKGLLKKARELGLEDRSELLLKPVLAVASCQARSREWGDVVTIHEDHSFAYVWSTKRGAQSGPVLRQDDWNVSAMKTQPPHSSHATSVVISACGNFALIGTKGGVIYKYNIQSGLPRGCFPKEASWTREKKRKSTIAGDINRTMKMLERDMKLPMNQENRGRIISADRAQNKLKHARHNGASVTGVAVDSLNKIVISVGMDAKLIIWSFATHAPHKRSPMLLPAPAGKISQLRESDLLAVALQDFSMLLFDCSAFSIVRRFGTHLSPSRHYGPLTDLSFGPDGRRLYSSSLDGTIRVWDIPTSTCVDWMAFETAPVALTLSSTGEFLATAHLDRLGISIWCDRSFFQMVYSNGSAPLLKPALMHEPATLAESSEDAEMSIVKHKLDQSNLIEHHRQSILTSRIEDTTVSDKVEPKQAGLITLSNLPVAHWKNLFHLELVKERNKPLEGPKKPPTAPFFLQWRTGETLNPNSQETPNNGVEDVRKAEDEEWAAVWSDTDEFNKDHDVKDSVVAAITPNNKKREWETVSNSLSETQLVSLGTGRNKKVKYFRSHLASLLEKCSQNQVPENGLFYGAVTQHISTLGPSAIDVSFATLCNGMHDIDDGLHLLQLAADWLLESCKTRQNYECVNAYLHRFLYLHATVLAGVDSDVSNLTPAIEYKSQKAKLVATIAELRLAHKVAAENLRNKMQQSLCLLRHFSRIV